VRVRIAIEREGPRVLIALRSETGRAITIDMHRRSAAGIAAQLAAASGTEDEDAELECEVRAELTFGDPRP
jgi:hypothetical protein